MSDDTIRVTVPPPSEAEIEAGRRLFAQDCRFVAGADAAARLPTEGVPEVAVAGRSNVGKSSLLNALTGRTTLARTSNTPGRTQQLNFFELGPEGRPRLVLVDLPGYGFAKVPKPLVDAWTRLLKTFLRGRSVLARACVLVDARHGLKPGDREIMDLLDRSAVAYQVVLTKIDKIPAAEVDALVDRTAAELATRPGAMAEVIATSARDGRGIASLRARLADLASGAGFD
ncbi:MAG: YihA family ribosome biogenesis GTP-binding protein [Alphaproteobacteria bacterium]|jgi:GTP-binding protein|nr:YihA family ribosome biogenesis GTP-binding protein [Alphaproteobacteria bacterium]